MVQLERSIWDDADSHMVDVQFISDRSSGHRIGDPRELSVIDIRDGLKVETHRGGYCYERKHGHSVDHKNPLDATPRAVDGTEKCSYTLEEQNDVDS